MTSSAGEQVDITATAIAIHGLPGPALIGRSEVIVIVTVMSGEVTPITALSPNAFEIYSVPLRTGHTSERLRIDAMSFSEVLPGVYRLTIADEQPSGESHDGAFLIKVATDADDASTSQTVLTVAHRENR